MFKSLLKLKPSLTIALIFLSFSSNAQKSRNVQLLEYDIAFSTLTHSSIPYQFSNSQSLRYFRSFNDRLGFDYSGFYNHSSTYPTDYGAKVEKYTAPNYSSVTESVMQVDHRKYGLRFGLAYHAAFSRFYLFNSSLGIYTSLDRVSYKLYWEDYAQDSVNLFNKQYYLSLKSPNLIDVGGFAQISLARNLYRNYYLGLRIESNLSLAGKRDLTFTQNEDKSTYDAQKLESRDINEMSGYFQKYHQQYHYSYTTFSLSLIYQLGFRL